MQNEKRSEQQQLPSHKVVNNVLLTLNSGEFIAVALTENNLIEVSKFIAQRFTQENPRFKLMGIKEEDFFTGCLDQCISALATGFGIIIFHKDPMSSQDFAPKMVAAFTYCDGFDNQFKGNELRWLKPNPNVSENLKKSKKIDDEFLKPITQKINDYVEMNGLNQPKMVIFSFFAFRFILCYIF